MKTKIVWIIIIAALMLGSCKKSFLDAKPSTKIIQPTTLEEFRSLLDNAEYMNNITSSLQQMAADEYYIRDYSLYQSLPLPTEQHSYIWDVDIYGGTLSNRNWNQPYQVIFYANNVLEGLPNAKGVNSPEWNNIKGWALFLRAFAYYELVRNFSPAYDDATANTDLGVPIRLNPAVDEIVQRASVKQTYDQILFDLGEARQLLTDNFSYTNRNRPSKSAAHALFARIYLSMRKYDKAEAYADSSLALYNTLIKYDSLTSPPGNPTALAGINLPFGVSNNESIYYATQLWEDGEITYSQSGTYYAVDTNLIKSYSVNDLRLPAFFKKNPAASNYYIVKGSYSGNYYPFTGLATDELYLVKAECAARRNDTATSMSFLNNLLIKRYRTGFFVRISCSSSQDALNKVLMERRKELPWRGLRWSDLKRLNKEGANIVLTRILNGQTYTLLPNDPRYVFPIPDDEIALSGIQQNIR